MGNTSYFGKAGNYIGTAIAILFFGMVGAYHSGLLHDAVKSYDCQNLIPEMLAISEKNAQQSNGVTLVGIVGGKTVTSTPKLVECSGKAKWSNATEGPIAYKAYVEDDQWWLQYNPG